MKRNGNCLINAVCRCLRRRALLVAVSKLFFRRGKSGGKKAADTQPESDFPSAARKKRKKNGNGELSVLRCIRWSGSCAFRAYFFCLLPPGKEKDFQRGAFLPTRPFIHNNFFSHNPPLLLQFQPVTFLQTF